MHYIYENVAFGHECVFGEFACVGLPPGGYEDGELPTLIGDRVCIRSHAVVYAGSRIGDDSVIGHGTFVRNDTVIGARVVVGAHNVWEGNIEVGDDVFVGAQTGVGEFTHIAWGVVVGPHVGMAAVSHPLSAGAKESAQGPRIEAGATIEAGVSIHPGVRIGRGALVQGGAVVVRDVHPFAVVSGNPAKPVGDVFTLAPGALKRAAQFIDVSSDAVAAARHRFECSPVGASR